MTRKRSPRLQNRADTREQRVAEMALDALADESLPTPLLVVNDDHGRVLSKLKASPWQRRAKGGRLGSAWPVGTFAGATIRVSRAWPAFEFALHGIAQTLPEGAPLYVYGGNDEGIRSVPKRLAPLFVDAKTLSTRRKCRLFIAQRTAAPARGLDEWRQTISIILNGVERPWISYPGVFARGRLDEGTALLLASVPRLEGKVLDFGAGTGVIAAALQQRGDLKVDMLEPDALALRAAAENVPMAQAVMGDGWTAVGGARYDAIVSNPPIHQGKSEDFGVLRALIEGAPSHLASGGALYLVVQRQIGVVPWLESAFQRVERLAVTGRFAMWSAQ